MENLTIIVILAIGNVVLVIALFFKSALNQILTDWWRERKEKKKVYKETLINIQNDFHKLWSEFYYILGFGNLINKAPEREKQLLFNTYQKPAMDKFSKFIVSLREKRMRLPDKIRGNIDNVMKGMVFALQEGMVNPDKAFEILTSLLTDCNIIDEQLSNEIDKR